MVLPVEDHRNFAVAFFCLVVDAPVVQVVFIARRCATTGAGWSKQCRKLWMLFLDMVVDVPVLATSWGSRGSAVAVHRLVCQLIMDMMSS